MCRFVAYLGTATRLDDLLFQGENSLIEQSLHARERAEPVNGDGFGVGFYGPEPDAGPAVFVSITPAWNNRNLRYNAATLRSECVFAHVRAASHGDVSEANCHPFHHERLLMMHNGIVGGFREMKRVLRRGLSDDVYHWVKGGTDSEHLFAVFLDRLKRYGARLGVKQIESALVWTIARIRALTLQCGIVEPAHLNLAVTDGTCLVATRYASDPDRQPPSLYYLVEPNDWLGDSAAVEREAKAVVISSERLGGRQEAWIEIPANHAIAVARDLSVSLTPLDCEVVDTTEPEGMTSTPAGSGHLLDGMDMRSAIPVPGLAK